MRSGFRARSLLRSALPFALLFLGAAPATQASIADDFADGEDLTPPWSHFAPTAGASFDASSQGYQIAVPATADPLDPARAARASMPAAVTGSYGPELKRVGQRVSLARLQCARPANAKSRTETRRAASESPTC